MNRLLVLCAGWGLAIAVFLYGNMQTLNGNVEVAMLLHTASFLIAVCSFIGLFPQAGHGTGGD